MGWPAGSHGWAVMPQCMRLRPAGMTTGWRREPSSPPRVADRPPPLSSGQAFAQCQMDSQSCSLFHVAFSTFPLSYPRRLLGVELGMRAGQCGDTHTAVSVDGATPAGGRRRRGDARWLVEDERSGVAGRTTSRRVDRKPLLLRPGSSLRWGGSAYPGGTQVRHRHGLLGMAGHLPSRELLADLWLQFVSRTGPQKNLVGASCTTRQCVVMAGPQWVHTGWEIPTMDTASTDVGFELHGGLVVHLGGRATVKYDSSFVGLWRHRGMSAHSRCRL
jgi:hypothetical protein